MNVPHLTAINADSAVIEQIDGDRIQITGSRAAILATGLVTADAFPRRRYWTRRTTRQSEVDGATLDVVVLRLDGNRFKAITKRGTFEDFRPPVVQYREILVNSADFLRDTARYVEGRGATPRLRHYRVADCGALAEELRRLAARLEAAEIVKGPAATLIAVT